MSVCLNMIVRDEAAVIERCLASVRPFIDYWVIVDTGSVDDTPDRIQAALRGVPGELHRRPWKNFGHNRTEALNLAKDHADYLLFIDADEIMGAEPGATLNKLTGPAYSLEARLGNVSYDRVNLVATSLPWRWEGVLHEYLECGQAVPQPRVPGFWVEVTPQGARSNDPRKYEKDAQVLLDALADEPHNSRYVFYLAQSYRDSGQLDQALRYYQQRAGMGGWDEEVWYSKFESARIAERLGQSHDQVVAAYLSAHQARPQRAEALTNLARYCRGRGEWHNAYLFASACAALPMTTDRLFVDTSVYHWLAKDEFALACSYTHRVAEAARIWQDLLNGPHLPEPDRLRIEKNLQGLPMQFTQSTSTLDVQHSKPDSIAPSIHREASSAAKYFASRFVASRPAATPTVFLVILAKQKEATLPFYLRCLEALDYPKSAISLYVRTNNNTDHTADILQEWLKRVGADYASVEFEGSDVEAPVQQYGVHEWNPVRHKVLGEIRQVSLQKALQAGSDFYFVVDVDNYVRPNTLRQLVALDLPIVGPLLRHDDPDNPYANYHHEIDANGYYAASEQYYWLLNRRILGINEVKVTHCTYLVRCDVIPLLTYQDGSDRYDYVIFSASARAAGIAQYLDNREIYGYLTLDESPDRCQTLLGDEIDAALGKTPDRMRVVASMTTIPSRIDQIRPVVEAVLAQSVPVDHLELNIPYQCIRTGESYAVPAWLESMDRVKIFRTEDYGPITKIAPTLLRYQNDHQTHVWSVDDDCAYPANQLALLCRVHDPDKRRILTRYGGKLQSDGSVQFLYGEADVTMFEGFGGVLYPPACVRENFLEYLEVTSANDDCRRNDDIVLAMYFNACGLPIHLFNQPSGDTPYMVSGWLPHFKQDSLSAQGHEENYKRIFNFINSQTVRAILLGLRPEERSSLSAIAGAAQG